MHPLKLAAYDPGRMRDGFAMIAGVVDENQILIKNAKVWYKTDITVVADRIAEIAKKARFDRQICEANNYGHTFIDQMRRYHRIHCIPITTTKLLKDIEKIKAGKTMAKNETVEWVEVARQTGRLLMPAKPWNDGIKLLDKQLSRFIRVRSGDSVSYRAAEDEDHDDLVSALLMLCHYARKHILKRSFNDVATVYMKTSSAYKQFDRMLASETEIKTEKVRNDMQKRIAPKIHYGSYSMKINGQEVPV